LVIRFGLVPLLPRIGFRHMPVVAAALGLAAVAWGVIVARRASLLVACGLLIVVGYVLGYEFWNFRLGPLPLTLDRMLLVGVAGLLVWRWRYGSITLRSMTGSDWALATLIALLCASAALSGQPDLTDGVTSKWGRLLASFLLPTALYVAVRQVPVTHREWSRVLALFVALGVYLALTGILEVAGAWSLVFPRYISNPNLGIHFGRARGPDLNSVSLGLYLTACCICAWLLLPEARRRWQQLAILIALPLMAFGVLLTYTRSTWIGFAASALIIAAIQMPRRWRLPALSVGAITGLLFVVVSWSQLMGLKREGTAAEAEHSVDQRASFAYVSWQMFCDQPILGVGFGRFFDRKMPYLSDRSQRIELESIRGLHHHNTLLSFLTETGLIGVAALAAVFIAWGRTACRLAMNATASPWFRAQGVLMLALIANYLCSAVFHDLTLLPSQELLLFMFAGLTVNMQQLACTTRTPTAVISAGANGAVTPVSTGSSSHDVLPPSNFSLHA